MSGLDGSVLCDIDATTYDVPGLLLFPITKKKNKKTKTIPGEGTVV